MKEIFEELVAEQVNRKKALLPFELNLFTNYVLVLEHPQH